MENRTTPRRKNPVDPTVERATRLLRSAGLGPVEVEHCGAPGCPCCAPNSFSGAPSNRTAAAA